MEPFEQEPFEQDKLSDGELDDLLRKWESPAAPARLRAAVFPRRAGPWWQRLWHASIRIPMPAGLAVAMVLAVAIWRWPAARMGMTASRVVTKIERVEVPVIRERIVTRTVSLTNTGCRDRVPQQQKNVQILRPVAELRPVIIRRENVRN
jgi:hypothetical protein